MKYKIFSLLIAFCLTAGVLTGCGSNPETAGHSVTGSTKSAETSDLSESVPADTDKQQNAKGEKTSQEQEGSSHTKDTAKKASQSQKEDEEKSETQTVSSSEKSSSGKRSSSKETASDRSGSSAKTSSAKSSSSKKSSSKKSSSSASSSKGSSASSGSGNSGSASKPAHQHSYSLVSEKAATCTSKGTRTYKCSCGKTKTETVSSPLGHKWKKHYKTVDVPAQTHTVAIKKYVCNGCGAQFDNGHDVLVHCAADFWDDCENYTYVTVDKQTIVDVPASTKQVYDYTYCERCNARK